MRTIIALFFLFLIQHLACGQILIKDSGSGSRNVDQANPNIEYYFFTEDYIKLKMMGFTVHKDAVKDIRKKFQK